MLGQHHNWVWNICHTLNIFVLTLENFYFFIFVLKFEFWTVLNLNEISNSKNDDGASLAENYCSLIIRTLHQVSWITFVPKITLPKVSFRLDSVWYSFSAKHWNKGKNRNFYTNIPKHNSLCCLPCPTSTNLLGFENN